MAVNGRRPAERRWCIKLWDMTSLGSVPVVRFFDVAAARLCAGDGPITALVGGSSCSIQLQAVHYNTVHLMNTKLISQYRLLTSTEDGAVQ